MDGAQPLGGTGPRIIKRYANRKLYDTAERRFTTLASLRDLARNGVAVMVRDHETGVDRTEEILGHGRVVTRTSEPLAMSAGPVTAGLRCPQDRISTTPYGQGGHSDGDSGARPGVYSAADSGTVSDATGVLSPVSDPDVEELRALRARVDELSKALDALIERSRRRGVG